MFSEFNFAIISDRSVESGGMATLTFEDIALPCGPCKGMLVVHYKHLVVTRNE